MFVTEKAYAKVNLTLGVTGKRTDGYHLLSTIMTTVSLFDEVTVSPAREVTVTASGMLLPYNNTLRKAAEGYRALTGRGAEIRVRKKIPAEAGLGGGSADGAAVLRAMQRLYGQAEEGELYDIALRVGADVPFCFHGGCCLCEGIGEILTPLDVGAPLHLVLVKPPEGVSTRALFTALQLPRPLPENGRAMAALAAGDAAALAPCLYNALEAPATACLPVISELLEELRSEGALAACMSGSGSTVFGLFADGAAAEKAAAAMKQRRPDCFAEAVRTV